MHSSHTNSTSNKQVSIQTYSCAICGLPYRFEISNGVRYYEWVCSCSSCATIDPNFSQNLKRVSFDSKCYFCNTLYTIEQYELSSRIVGSRFSKLCNCGKCATKC